MSRTDSISGSEESGGRKLRQLADGRISRGYVPLEVEALEAPVSAEAIGLLARVRHACSQRESDGEIDGLAMQAVAVYCQVGKRLSKLLGELKDAGLVELLPGGGVRDLNYPCWGRTRGELIERRERWRDNKRRARAGDSGGNEPTPSGPPSTASPPPVSQMSTVDNAWSPPHVHSMSPTLEAEAEAEAEAEVSTTPVVPSGGVRGGQPPGTVMPMPLSPEVVARNRELVAACSEFLVRPLRGTERDLVLAWASRLRRGGELVPVVEILAVVQRKMLLPTPDGPLPANLAWCADDVAALARTPIDPSVAVDDWRQLSERARSYGDVTG